MDITTNGRSRGSENPQPLMLGSASVSGCFGGDTPPGACSFRAIASADDAPSSAKPSSFFLLLMFTREPKCLYADNGGTGGTAAFLECLESCRISDPSVGSSAVRPLAREGCRSNVAVLKNCSAPSEAGHLLSQCPPPLAGAIIQVLVLSFVVGFVGVSPCRLRSSVMPDARPGRKLAGPVSLNHIRRRILPPS